MSHTLPDLPYAYNALDPYIDEETMKLHHGKHHLAYVKNLNATIEKYADLASKSAEELIMDLGSVPEDIRSAVRNNAGGHVNHTMFWESMTPTKEEDFEKIIQEEINSIFGSLADFQSKFNDAGLKRFGSGWVWLVQNKEGKLEIVSTPNQDNPMTDGQKPILGNDVWEHAYYLKYKNIRADYLKAWWNVVNWQEVDKRYNEK